MYGMAQAAGELMEQGPPAYDSAVPILSQLLKAETAEREVRSVAYQIKAARFPVYKDLNGFNFASSEANEALVRQLHRCELIENADNVVLVGGPGTGKSHIATALGVQAVEHHRKKVRFFGTVDLVNALEQEKAQGRSGQIADRLIRCDEGLRRYHHQSELQRMGRRVRRRQDDNGHARPSDASLPRRRDRQRQLPLQSQRRRLEGLAGEREKLDLSMNPQP